MNAENILEGHGYQRVQSTTFYSDGALHIQQQRSKGVQHNDSPCAHNHCSTRYEQSFRHNKHTHTNQRAATDHHSRHNYEVYRKLRQRTQSLHTIQKRHVQTTSI